MVGPLPAHAMAYVRTDPLPRTSSVEEEMRTKKELVIRVGLPSVDATPPMAAHQRGQHAYRQTASAGTLARLAVMSFASKD